MLTLNNLLRSSLKANALHQLMAGACCRCERDESPVWGKYLSEIDPALQRLILLCRDKSEDWLICHWSSRHFWDVLQKLYLQSQTDQEELWGNTDVNKRDGGRK